MRGHEPILAMRKAGKRPAVVFLNDYPGLPGELDWAQHGEHATVEVCGDQPELLDLRFLVGMRVSISAETVDRAERFMQACKEAGAELVGAGVVEVVNGRHEGVWSAVWRRQEREAA
jgi:hypothetical protein